MKFRGIFVQQESICATFGAGVSSAVVVDIGAQKTNIACIEEGVCQVDSRICIAMGGDDITRTFTSFLHTNKFPYAQMDLDKSYDWRLADELKQRWCTMNEADISVQVYDFFARTPFTTTIKYQCKVYDEVFLAPLCLMYPAILNAREKSRDKKTWTTQYVTDDVIEDYNVRAFILFFREIIPFIIITS
jgi:actin-related protein 8